MLVTEDVWPTDGKIGLLSGTEDELSEVLLKLFCSPDSLETLVGQESLPMIRRLLDGQFDLIESIDALHITRPRISGQMVSLTARLFVDTNEGRRSIIVDLHLSEEEDGLKVVHLQMEKNQEEY